jgi:hypothetical protein
MDLQEVGWESMGLIDLILDGERWRVLVIMVLNFRVPQNAGHFLTSREQVSFSRRNLLQGVSK